MTSTVFGKFVFGLGAMAWLMMPQTIVAQGPIVVLEYPGYASDSTRGLNQENPFV